MGLGCFDGVKGGLNGVKGITGLGGGFKGLCG